jgi:glyoxylase-like metal-dependent hydrolase (beta-lactamase superfamily II)/ferredoxin
MARIVERLRENVEGEFFVDRSCIDCGMCREVAPRVYAREDRIGLSVVRRQPATEEERLRAAMGLIACPTASIGTLHKIDLSVARRRFPEPIEAGVDDVFACGWASRSSYGASSWLVRRADGNVLVDSPRASRTLLERIRSLGGARYMFLTHRDDVADHAFWQGALGCERVMHADDVTAATKSVERRLTGREPVVLAPDLLAIPVPGHTRGSIALSYRDEYLFTGDHLWGEDGALGAGRDVCWYSWSEQLRSLARLRDHRFRWVLPGHGGRHRASSYEGMRADLDRLLSSLAGQPG